MKRFWKFLPALRKKGRGLFTVEIGLVHAKLQKSNSTDSSFQYNGAANGRNRYQVDSLYNDFLSEYNKMFNQLNNSCWPADFSQQKIGIWIPGFLMWLIAFIFKILTAIQYAY